MSAIVEPAGVGSTNTAAPTQSGGQIPPEPGGGFGLQLLVDRLKNVKELLVAAAFFGGGLVWVVNFFATREQLEALECFTKINVRMLQTTANVRDIEAHARQGRIELRDQQSILERAQKAKVKAEGDIKILQGRIDELLEQKKSFDNSIGSEKKSAQRALDALTQNLCLIKEQRTKILERLGVGDF